MTINLVRAATITLPAAELSLLLIVLSFCLVLKFCRVGLIAAYLFLYRWGWMFFISARERYQVAYLVFGAVVGLLTVIGMLQSPGDN